MMESVIKCMHWKAFFFWHGEKEETKEREETCTEKLKMPSHVHALWPFEEEMLELIEFKFEKTTDDFKKKMLKAVMDKTKKSDAMFVQSDKSRNLY